jgi:4-azaleucine resistance transporter AzlC
MTSSTAKSTFWRGIGDGLPFVLAAGPFGFLFAVLATEAGMDIYQVMVMSVFVIAGASQFAALAQMQEAAPVVFVLFAALAVNMRMAMYSASLAPHMRGAPLWQRALAAYILVDNSYAVAITEFERAPEQARARKILYYFGCSIPVWIAWYAATFAGAIVGKTLPIGIPIDFAVPIAFLSILAPLLRTVSHLAAAGVSVVVMLSLWWLPYNSGLIVAALLAMITGVQVERRLAR